MSENRCVICLKEIEVIEKPDGTKIVCDNSAQPLMDGRCCDACDCLLVIPSRHIGKSLLTDIGSMMLSQRLLQRHTQKKGEFSQAEVMVEAFEEMLEDIIWNEEADCWGYWKDGVFYEQPQYGERNGE